MIDSCGTVHWYILKQLGTTMNINETKFCSEESLLKLLADIEVKVQNWSKLCLSEKHPESSFCSLNNVVISATDSSFIFLFIYFINVLAKTIFCYNSHVNIALKPT